MLTPVLLNQRHDNLSKRFDNFLPSNLLKDTSPENLKRWEGEMRIWCQDLSGWIDDIIRVLDQESPESRENKGESP